MKTRKRILLIPMITIALVIGYPTSSFSAEKTVPSPSGTNMIEIDECWKRWNWIEQRYERKEKSKIAYRSCLTQLEELRRMLGLETAAENESGRTLYQAEITEKDAECRLLFKLRKKAILSFRRHCFAEQRRRERPSRRVPKPKYCGPHVLCESVLE